MDELIEHFKKIDPLGLDYKKLFDHIIPFVNKSLNYQAWIPELQDQLHYTRTIILTEPVELVLIHWPAGVESAIHHHAGFWGYVGVLKGEARNVEYTYSNKTLKQKRSVLIRKNGVIPEPDGVVHKLANASQHLPLLTLHFYFPALKDLDGLRLFGEDGTLGVLNGHAASASLDLPENQYRSLVKNQFSYNDGLGGKSHLMSPILPKPSGIEIKKMLADYYADQAQHYDQNDLDSHLRINYVRAINQIIADDFIQSRPQEVLALACGTGRRAQTIKAQSGIDYRLSGVDLSPEMCDIAKKRGLKVYCQDWMDVDVPHASFDAITMLYSFGHVPSAMERIRFVEKVFDKLKSKGVFYFDVFDLNDPYEWGANALNVFNEYNLDCFGYEKGDVFYRRSKSDKIAFLHYFEEDRTRAVLESIGFKVEFVKHIGYVHRCGEILKRNEGSLFFKVVKP